MCFAMAIVNSDQEVAYLITDNAATVLKCEPVGDATNVKEMLDAVEYVIDYGCKVIKLDESTGLAWMTYTSNPIGYIEEESFGITDPLELEKIKGFNGFMATSKGGFGAWFFDSEGAHDMLIGDRPGLVNISFRCTPFFGGMVQDVLSPLIGEAIVTKSDVVLKNAFHIGLAVVNKVCPLIGPQPYMAKISKRGFEWI